MFKRPLTPPPSFLHNNVTTFQKEMLKKYINIFYHICQNCDYFTLKRPPEWLPQGKAVHSKTEEFSERFQKAIFDHESMPKTAHTKAPKIHLFWNVSVLHQDEGGIGKSIPAAKYPEIKRSRGSREIREIFRGRGFCTPRPEGFPEGEARGKSRWVSKA